MAIKVPENFQQYLLLIAATQRMGKITPLELFTCITAFIGKKRGLSYLDEAGQRLIKAYFARWNLEDFTIMGEEE